MSKKDNSCGGKKINEGFVPCKKGYKPSGGNGNVTSGHKPEKSEAKPVNPPKKK
ncbi:MAG: hypothetical protein SCH71_17455 [Desulfobulbaceae bacterium]|nr:hypothetical protein [Desulfobulbaceae bacterium]